MTLCYILYSAQYRKHYFLLADFTGSSLLTSGLMVACQKRLDLLALESIQLLKFRLGIQIRNKPPHPNHFNTFGHSDDTDFGCGNILTARSSTFLESRFWRGHKLRTPIEGINQINLKIWADVADKICFGHT